MHLHFLGGWLDFFPFLFFLRGIFGSQKCIWGEGVQILLLNSKIIFGFNWHPVPLWTTGFPVGRVTKLEIHWCTCPSVDREVWTSLFSLVVIFSWVRTWLLRWLVSLSHLGASPHVILITSLPFQRRKTPNMQELFPHNSEKNTWK